MKDSSYNSSQSVHKAETLNFEAGQAEGLVGLDDTKETVSQFLDKIAVAKSLGEESVEASVDIIKHYNRRGLMGADFFIYEGIKVFPKGKREEIEALINMSAEEKLHNKRP